MLPSFLLSLREGLEGALIIGIVLGVLHKINRNDMKPVVWQGVASALVVSLLAALLLNYLGAEFESQAEEIFEGVAMLLAAALLTWMIFWMQGQASSFKQNLEIDVYKAASSPGKRAVFILAFISIAREGMELALFLTATKAIVSGWGTLIGALSGLFTAVVLGYLLFATTNRLRLKSFFRITNILLILFAAGLVANGVHELNEAGVIPTLVDHLWDINTILDDHSTMGELMKALFGYNGNPSLSEVLSYISYFVLLWVLLKSNLLPKFKTKAVEST